MDAHPILKGIGIAVPIILLVGIRLGLFRYIFEKITEPQGTPGGLLSWAAQHSPGRRRSQDVLPDLNPKEISDLVCGCQPGLLRVAIKG